MLLTLHFFLGFITSFMGMIMPSMLNMTAAKISLEKGRRNALKFAVGVSIIVFGQAYLATMFTVYLRDNPMFVASLQKIALVVFAGLSFYFYRECIKDQKTHKLPKKKTNKNFFVAGIFLSFLNMFSIPFYCGITTALDVVGLFQFSDIYILFFVIGSTLGTFVLLYVYLNYAEIIQSRAKGASKNMNLILAIITGALAIITLVKLVYSG